jgi:hypothetical protein
MMIPALGYFTLIRVAVEGGQLRMALAIPADVQQRADVVLTLWSFSSGEELSFNLCSEAAPDSQVFALQCQVIDEWVRRQGSEPLGLALRYRYRGQFARYRLGRALLNPEIIATLPITLTSTLQLELTPEAGALAVTVRP